MEPTYAILRGRPDPVVPDIHRIVRTPDLVELVVDGRRLAYEGRPVREPDDEHGRLGAWTDGDRDMTQHLLPGGRYTETRSGVRDAWTGAYWVDGERITYLDDTGFWAFGEWHGGVLHHAGFVLRPSA